jgi:uncharacterized protein YukE
MGPVDPDHLRTGLDAYRQSLLRHRERLTGELQTVQAAWAALDHQYRGRAAEDFRNRWRGIASWFEEYTDAVRTLCATLDERIEALDEHNRL